jgi:hypothetical protein
LLDHTKGKEKKAGITGAGKLLKSNELLLFMSILS